MLIISASRGSSLSGHCVASTCARHAPVTVLASPQLGAQVAASSTCSFVLSQSIFLRWLGGLFLVANLVALRQNKALLGADGLLPIDTFLRSRVGSDKSFWKRPTFFWCVRERAVAVNTMLDAHAIAGMALSIPLLLSGTGSTIQMFALWALYTSLTNVGQRWYAFGWESLLLETSFLAIFMCPLRLGLGVAGGGPVDGPSAVCVWAFRWLLFRVMLGAGLIKLRSSDRCWQDLTAMNFHYETQPVPNPLSRSLHRAPPAWHRFETFFGLYVVEVVAPFLLLLPGGGRTPLGAAGLALRRGSAVLQVAFQLVLIASGNLAFLNFATIAPALMCLDDAFWAPLLQLLRVPTLAGPAAAGAAAAGAAAAGAAPPRGWSRLLGLAPHAVLAGLLVWCSMPVLANLLSPRQRMNAAFGPWRLVNSYGAFGSVTKRRFEVELQGTRDEYPTDDAEWRAFEFVAKPGDPARAPRWLAPYHLRLDWLMWFLPFGSWRQSEWLQPLVRKLLVNDARVSALLAHNPFLSGEPPRWVRAELWEYRFASPEEASEQGVYWSRQRVREWMPPIKL